MSAVWYSTALHVRTGLLNPQGHPRNGDCEERSVHFQLYRFLQRFIRIQFNWVCYHSRKDRQVRQRNGHAHGHGLSRLYRQRFKDYHSYSILQAEGVLGDASAYQ